MSRLATLRDQLVTVSRGLSGRAKAVIILAVLLVGGGLAYFGLVDRTEYAVLFTGLATEDAARITEQLRKTRVPFNLEAGGATVLVPADKVHEIRLTLAGQGLPRGSGVGFEIFDAQRFGLSDFAQQINFRRALQGELERTVSQLDAVAAARVHIALPEHQVFARRAQPVSAAVTVRLHPGRSLSRASVNAIVHLVSSSVPGLTPERITVVDSTGAMLWSGKDGLAGSGGPLEARRSLEEGLERRVIELLDAAVGPGHSVVKVTADVALAEVEQTETRYDPDSVSVRSETGLEEKDARGPATPGGVPGVQGNLPGGPSPSAGSSEGASQRKSFSRNYEVNQTVRKKVMPAGELRRLSIAVLVDRAAVGKTPGKPALDLAALEQVVRQAVGFSATRGDVVALQSVPFAPERQLPPPPGPFSFTYLVQNPTFWAKPLLALLLVVIALMTLRWVRNRPADVLELPRTVRELEARALPAPAPAPAAVSAPAQQPIALSEASNPARDLSAAAAEHDAARAASVLKSWMAGG